MEQKVASKNSIRNSELHLKYVSDNWEGRQVFITGFSSKDKSNSRLQAASLKVDPFAKCLESHNEEKFLGDDEASISSRFKLGRSLPQNFKTTLMCAKHSTEIQAKL